ncbi:MAG: hypothetical protein JWQ57_1217, partial [Mucilaginibacter sp.]|nr:hypothetical protein [Mucilaginibacter sp.]
LGEHQTAFEQVTQRTFHPWEGGEGKASGQYVAALVEMAKQNIRDGKNTEAIEQLTQAQTYPHNLGEGKLFGTQENDIFYWLGKAYENLQQTDASKAYFEKAAIGLEDPTAAVFYNDQQPDKIFYQGLAKKCLGDSTSAERIFKKLLNYGIGHMDDNVKIDYFAVSLPNLLIFEDDLKARNQVHCHFLQGLGYLGLHDFEHAQKAFAEVLKQDAGHFGARIHQNMINQITEVAG